MTKWTNNDGLVVKFGASEAERSRIVKTSRSPTNWVVGYFKVGDNVTVDSVSDGLVDDQGNRFYVPKGSILLRAFFVTDVAFDSGGSATLDIGLVASTAGTYTGGGDEDYIAAAVTEASIDTAGKVVDLIAASTGGAGISENYSSGFGAATSADLLFAFDVDTVGFDSGEGRIVTEWINPPAIGPNNYADA